MQSSFSMHIYVHVPFCARRCSYCDFSIAVRRTNPSAIFAATIEREWRSWLEAPWWSEVGPIETIYFGGGTPSLLDPEAIGRIVGLIRETRVVAPAAELTLEANPEDLTEAKAMAWARHGINRVSLGVQSFSDPVLQWMHRIHDARQPGYAVAALRAAGLANFSIDLIYGLPTELARDWRRDLELAFALEPAHLSLYALTVERDTPLGKWVARGEVHPVAEGSAADDFLVAHQALLGQGYQHYEVSNAGRPGFDSRHNRAYWTRASYLGLGPAAHSAHRGHRWWNVRAWERYRRVVAGGGGGGRAVEGEETLRPDQTRLEDIYLGLRTDSGVPALSLPGEVVNQWVDAGWAGRDGSRVRLTPEGWLRLDSLVRQVDGV